MSQQNFIRFRNKRLRVMHITDTHLSDKNIKASCFLIEKGCERERPDIVVITGDNVENEENASVTDGYINELMSVFERLSIPVAVTFGNHDSETGALSRKELMLRYSLYSCHTPDHNGVKPFENASYAVPVLSSEGERVCFNLWVFDSGDYDGKGHYGCMSKEDVDWYKNMSDTLRSNNGGKPLYSLAFQHIILPEVYDALKPCAKRKLYSFAHMYDKNKFYMFDPDNVNYGTLNETPCCGYENFGQFDAMTEKGDVLAVFSGHDHTNAFGVRHKGIDIVNSLSTRSQNDRFSTQYGYRIIDIDENDTSRYSTYVMHWYNMFTLKDIREMKKNGDVYGSSIAAGVTFRGLIQRFHTFTGRTFCRIVTGRKNTYKH